VRNIYDPVALVYNHGILDCRTRYLIFTHNDLVPISQTVVSDLISSCSEDIPVVGYESCPFPNYVGTQLTVACRPVLDQVRIRWEMATPYTWVEEGFNRCLGQAGITPRLIGREKQGRVRTPHFDHVGRLVTTRVYFQDSLELVRVKADLDQVLEESEQRLQSWRGA
jgi:hypothetical protein